MDHGLRTKHRPSLLADADFRGKLDGLAQKEGSNSGSLFVDEAHFVVAGKNVRVILGANAVRELKELLVGRLGFSRPLSVSSSRGRLRFVPGDAVHWRATSETQLEIAVPAPLAVILSDALLPKVGNYMLGEFPTIVFEVRRSEITDADGNIVEVVG
ncbi:MAG: hypothetical protein HYR84_02630 [Planctomycetes bacterium]|nr:hypothetical protein [Planctomycetota bacterium]